MRRSGQRGNSAAFAYGVLCEFIVQVGEFLFFDALHFYGVVESLAGELLVGIIVGIFRPELLGLTRRRAPQVLVEAVERLFCAEVAENVVGLNWLAAAFGQAAQFDEDVIAIFCGAAFDRNVRGRALT